MARVYNTRQLLDPNMISILNQQAANRLQFETGQNKAKYDAIRKALGTAGSVGQNMYDQSRRASEMEDEWSISPEVLNDPVYKAAREEYIRTGSSGPLQQYILQKQAADARKEESKLRAEQAAKDKAWHDAVRLAQARPEYGKVQKAMFDAIDAGDYETADIMKKQLQAYETEFGSEAFGGSAESMAEARKKSAEAAATKKAEEERLARMGENLEKEFADKSYEQRIWVETNIIPKLKNVADKAEAKTQVERMAANLTDEDRKALHAKIDAVETLGEKKKKSVEGAVATKAGEATGEAIDEAKNKTTATQYNGKNLNSLEWNKIPKEVKKFLNRDAAGNVSMKE